MNILNEHINQIFILFQIVLSLSYSDHILAIIIIFKRDYFIVYSRVCLHMNVIDYIYHDSYTALRNFISIDIQYRQKPNNVINTLFCRTSIDPNLNTIGSEDASTCRKT